MSFSKIVAGTAATLAMLAPSIASASATRSADVVPVMVKKVASDKASGLRTPIKKKATESKFGAASTGIFVIGGLVVAGGLIAVISDS